MNRHFAAFFSATILLVSLSRCGGQEGSASETFVQPKQAAAQPQPMVDVDGVLQAIAPSIPVYEGASFSPELTSRDATMLRNQFGADTQVYTLQTNDSFPQVWHYYVTYLAQFRAFAAQPPYPPENQINRSIEIPLNVVMRDPFIPGDGLQNAPKNVVLQVTESEGEPHTLIRYIVRPPTTLPPVESGPAVAQTQKSAQPESADSMD